MLQEPGLLLTGTFFRKYKTGKGFQRPQSKVPLKKPTAGKIKQQLSEKPFSIHILPRLEDLSTIREATRIYKKETMETCLTWPVLFCSSSRDGGRCRPFHAWVTASSTQPTPRVSEQIHTLHQHLLNTRGYLLPNNQLTTFIAKPFDQSFY